MAMIKITMVVACAACMACGGAPFTVGPDGIVADDAGMTPPADDAGQPTADDAGVQAARDAIVPPDAAPDTAHPKQPEEDAAPHEAEAPDAGQDTAPPVYLCGGEATRCLDGNTVETCVQQGGLNMWGPLTACQGVCLNGDCAACAPGGTADCSECANAGTQTCTAAGVWGPCSASCS